MDKIATKQGHTGGDWKVVSTTAKGAGSSRKDVVAEGLEFSPSYIAGDMLPEDAILLAAAPGLLKELKAIILLADAQKKVGDRHLTMRQWELDDARAALAKAEGRQS